jgi:hypothetical protein
VDPGETYLKRRNSYNAINQINWAMFIPTLVILCGIEIKSVGLEPTRPRFKSDSALMTLEEDLASVPWLPLCKILFIQSGN